MESNPAILCSNETPICLAAACGGLLNAAALIYAKDMPSLCRVGLDTIRLARRLIEVVAARSRSVQDGPGCWGWLVSGVDASKLQSIIDSYHKTKVRCLSYPLITFALFFGESWTAFTNTSLPVALITGHR